VNAASDCVIHTQGIVKNFGKIQVLNGVDLCVPRGSIFGFLGPNGAGKTTTMKILLGLSRPSGGQGTIFGHDISTGSLAVRERTGFLPQQPRFIGYMTARENVLFAARFHYRGPFAALRRRCEEMLDMVGLLDKADRQIHAFSGGEKQRLGIAMAQVNDPDLLILDEPASALDPLGRQAVLEIMARLRQRTTIFYSTHILNDVQRVSDTVAILNHGRVAASGPVAEILAGSTRVVYLLSASGAPFNFQTRLAALPYVAAVQEVDQNGVRQWEIHVSDPAAASALLLRQVLEDEAITVTGFSRKKADLEEVFMEIVKGDGYDR
jgi:ABC-2 type transport system ATP-binding protein